MKVLIVKPSSFGDIVQSLPVATGLKRGWPEAQVHWVVFDAYASFLQGHPAIDKVWAIPRRRWMKPNQWKNAWTWVKAIQGERFDLVLDLQGLLRSAVITALTRAPRRLGLWSSREGSLAAYNEKVLDPPPPAQEKYLEFLRYLGIPPDPFDFQLVPPPLAVTALEKKEYIALHPYTRWRTKLWPWRYYAEVMRLMPDKQFVVVGEGPWFPLDEPNCFDLRNKLPLPQLMSVLDRSRALVSTDSGPAHLGAALGVPTVVLFGATDWRKSRPIGRKVSILHYPVPCAPCLKRNCPQLTPMVCLSAVSPEQVVERLRYWEPKNEGLPANRNFAAS